MTTPLYVLRCVQLGLKISELDDLEMGFIMDMMTEKSNDDYEYPVKATQEDFDNF